MYWNGPEKGFPTGTTFTVEYRAGNTGDWTEQDAGTGVISNQDHQYESSDTASGTSGEMTYRVKSVLGSEESAPVSATITLTSATNDNANPVLVDADLTVTGNATKLNRIDLKWARKAGDNTPKPTGYVIDYRVTGPGTAETHWRRLQSNTGYSKGYYNHQGLMPGVTHEYRVLPTHNNKYGRSQDVTASTKAAVAPDPCAA